MKIYRLFLVVLTILIGSSVFAQSAGFPQVSNGTKEYWYYLKFTQGSFVVSSDGEKTICKAQIPSGQDNQLWKLETSNNTEYTFTNKLGLKLYLSGTSRGGEVRAAANPSSLKLFKVKTTGEKYIITPSSNEEQAFNVWGGMGFRNDIKLYDSNDANAPIVFIVEDSLSLTNAKVNVVPYPSSLTMGEGVLDLHTLTAITVPEATISVPAGAPSTLSLSTLANRLAEDLQRIANISLPVSTTATSSSALSLTIDETLAEEAYHLAITSSAITIAASEYGGFFNALQTLRQLMPPAIFGKDATPDASWTVPCLTIQDVPAMSHRGFHLDVSRHFFGKDEVKKLLDAASIYKLNRFHWHLTDDQGWRIEIPEYPLLTTVGAVRKASLSVYDPTSGFTFFDDTEYGRGYYYTLDDLREIVAYAAERNIQIIPEVDMPGHMVAGIVAYPELGCAPERKIELLTAGGVSRDILNIGKEETIDFLKCVLGHVAEVFPYELMHIGGDECPTAAWETNADCQALIKKEGLSGVKDLQPWLVEKLGCYLRDNYGKTMVVWDELLANWNNNYTIKPVIMAWRGADYASKAADRGLKSIMVPSRPLYFDLLQFNPNLLETNSPYIGGYGDNCVNSVENVYNFNPRSAVSDREQYVLGTQANLWTESCTSNREAEYQYYPRLLALSEIAWLPNDKKDFVSFYNRLQHHAAILKAKNITYAPHYFNPVKQTPEEAAIAEAEEILANSIPGEVGYPQEAEATALRSAVDALRAALNDPSTVDTKRAALTAQISAYKAAPIVQPEADHLYQIVSAATYFRNRFNGSTLYTKGKELTLHYTAQTEPEELWQFLPQTDGSYQVVSAQTGHAISFPTINNGTIKIDGSKGSKILIRKATKPTKDVSYIPGVVNIKQKSKNLYAKINGDVLTMISSNDSTLCYPGTWRIVEVKDYRHWLQQLVDKAERLVAESNSHAIGQPTEEALQFLSSDVLTPARKYLAQEEVSREEYLSIVKLYAQFRDMKVNVVTDFIDTSHYYLIRNGYYYTNYAAANDGNIVAETNENDDALRWYFVINEDGTVSIYNKKTNTPAYVTSNSAEQAIQLGKDYHWTLDEVTTDQGNTNIAIIDKTGTYSWYSYNNVSSNILLRPYKYGASVWELILTDEKVTTGISEVPISLQNRSMNQNCYDLTGRRLKNLPAHGVYIQNGRLICK